MHALLAALGQPGVAAVVAGALTGTFALSGVGSPSGSPCGSKRARRREDNNKIEAAVAELVSTVIDLQDALGALIRVTRARLQPSERIRWRRVGRRRSEQRAAVTASAGAAPKPRHRPDKWNAIDPSH
ncbi:hypothetical protein ACNTMW_31135 [Planosporangium sp. 12N6]|uniref:hypothetical protein n=1 Tax=Planosporangium spinosum TaxID=3402278 RepID=UPI003CEE2AFB